MFHIQRMRSAFWEAMAQGSSLKSLDLKYSPEEAGKTNSNPINTSDLKLDSSSTTLETYKTD